MELRGAFIGSPENPFGPAVSVLTTDTAAANGDQWIHQFHRLTELNMNAGSTGDISLTQAAAPAQSLTTAGMGVRNLAAGGLVTLTNLGESINVVAAAPIETSNGDITLAALDFNILAAINSGTAPTTLANSTTGRPIDVGTNTTGSISLTDLELDQVTASVLRIGSATAGIINVNAPITQAGSGYEALSLRSGHYIFQSYFQAIITVDDLAIQGSYVLMGQNNVTNLAGTSSGFTFTNTTDLNVGTVDGIVGITSTSEYNTSVGLYSVVGGTTLTVSQPILANLGGVFLRFDDVAINAAITATAGALMSGFVWVQLTPFTAALPIDVGGAFEGAALHLSDAELDLVNADRFLYLGQQFYNNGDIIVSSPITQTGSGYTAMVLHTRGAIVDATGGEQTDITVTSLTVRVGAGIGADDDLDTGLSNLAFHNTGGSVNITNTGALTITAVDPGGTSGNYGTTTTISASSPLTFAVHTTSVGDATYTAGETNDAIVFADDLTLNAGVIVNVLSGDLTLQAGDSILLDGGSTVSGSGTVTLNMGFGDLDGVGGARIQGTVDSGIGIPGAVGGEAADGLLVDFTAGANLPDGLDFQGGGHLIDQLTLSDEGGTAAHTYDINGARVIRDGATTISTTNGVEGTRVDGGNLSDTFHVTPDVSTTIFISGSGTTTPASSGDSLDVDLTGTTNPFLRSIGPTGNYRFDNRRRVNFSGIETLDEEVDLAITKTDGQDTAEPGSTVTYTIVVSNAGAIGVGGALVTDFFPIHLAGLSGVSYTSVASGGATGNKAAGTGFINDFLNLPIGASVTYTATATITQNASGNLTNTATVTFPGAAEATPGNNTATDTTLVADINLYAVGGPHVCVFTGPAAEEKFSFFAYDPNFTGGVRVAMGDVTGDGVPDIITAPGPGGGPHVRVFDGRTGNPVPGLIGSFYAYHDNFGGVFVASADFNGDGFADVVTGADAGAGSGPHIRVFSGSDGSELFGFFDGSKLDGGVRVAAGDIDGDGTPDIISASGPGDFPSVVRVFSGATQQPLSGAQGSILPYAGFQGGVYVASGDVDGDGRADIITGAGAGGGPHVKAFSGVDGSLVASFFAYDTGFTGGVRVGVGEVNDDGQLDIITGAGPGGGPHVKAFGLLGGGEVASFFAFAPAFNGGVFVGGAAMTASGSSTASSPGSDAALLRSAVGTPQSITTPSAATNDDTVLLKEARAALDADLAFSVADSSEEDWLSPSGEAERAVADVCWETLTELVHGALR